MKYKIIQIVKNDFPEKLKQIKNAPEILYAIGDINLLYQHSFGIVGTRKISNYGIINCENFTKEFVIRDIPTVSGLALGTDTIVHKTTIELNGKTIAILGSGFSNIYPIENIELFNQIIERGGLVLTEFEDKVKPIKENFPQRNRIITAISDGILVIEAAYRSGTSITAKHAKEQDKRVFAIPGLINSPVGIGVNRMIKNGAILTTEIDDILQYYPQFASRIKREIVGKKNNIKEEYFDIYNFLNERREASFDEILRYTNISMRELIIKLTNMELESVIKQEISGKYILL